MIIWRKGKGGAGMPLQIGYLGKLPMFHIFWNSFGSGSGENQYRLDVALSYTKGIRHFVSEEKARAYSSTILEQWLTATGLKEDDE